MTTVNSSTMPTGPETKRHGTVTLADVAKLAGVSTITASRALSNPRVVSPDTQRKVREAVEATGYVPNLLAGGLKSNRSRLIACLSPALTAGSIFIVAIQAMTEAFADAGYQVILGQRGFETTREETLIDAIIARRPEGIVLMGTLESPRARHRLQASGIPVVETWDMSDAPIDMLVGFSHRDAGAAIAAYFERKGRRKLAVLSSSNDPRARARGTGFIEAAAQLGLPAVVMDQFVSPSRMMHGREGLRRILHGTPDIDGIFCATDLVALGALAEAQAQGIKVPERLAVVGFGDSEFATAAYPTLTTVRVESVEIGRQVASMIIARVEGKSFARDVIDLGFSIAERASA